MPRSLSGLEPRTHHVRRKRNICPITLPWLAGALLCGEARCWRSCRLTLHDGYVHSPPTRPRYATEARPMGDGWTASAGHKASPADTNTETHKHHCTERQLPNSQCSQWVLLIYWHLQKLGAYKKMGRHWRSDGAHSDVSEVTTLPVDFWRFAFDFGTLLHHLFCHSSTVTKHRDDAQDMFYKHKHAHTHALMHTQG